MKLLNPRSHDGSIAEASATAESNREPVFVSVEVYVDDRGWSIMNQFQGVLSPEGQINYSVVYPNVVKAWHRHARQTDFWMCLHGQIKVGVHREDDGASWMMVMGEKRPGVMIIPPPLWHGVGTVGPDPAGLLYYVTHAYDPAAPDEQRREFDSIAGFSWEVEHR